MWTKLFLVVAVAAVTTRARISGLQNDLGTGYSYSQPEHDPSPTHVQASLAYYINIPASSDTEDQIYLVSNANRQHPSHFDRGVPPPDYGGNSINNRFRQPEAPLQAHQDLSHFNPYQGNHHYRQFPSSPIHPLAYHTDPRSRPHNPLPLPTFYEGNGYSIQQSIVEHLPRTSQDYRQLSFPSQDLLPPPYNPHLTLQVEPKSFAGSTPQQYRIVPSVASLPMSYNAPLPFPIGVVPIKFRPLPLKTHLRQAGLLPITSYQARESYRK